MSDPPDFAQILQRARRRYVERAADRGADVPWWTAVAVTASSERQAERYRDEIGRRREQGTLPAGVVYLVVADPQGERIGSGGATFNALRALAEACPAPAGCESLAEWWQGQRVLVVHAGGDSRRLAQYSASGKPFTALPVKTPWGGVSTVFDEFLALSTLWAERLGFGLVVGSGDVVLTFEAEALRWDRPGVSGVAIRQPVEVGRQHGVYVADREGRVYSFLQKPTAAQLRAAGGMLADDQVALDSGLMRFDAGIAARMSELAGVRREAGRWTVGEGVVRRTAEGLPVIGLYEHIARSLTGEWTPPAQADPLWREIRETFAGCPFWCDLVEGDFVHIGTTALFRRLMTQETDFSRLYDAQQRLGAATPAGVRSAGVIVDSVLPEGSELAPGCVAIECHLEAPVRAGRGAILHGLTGAAAPIQVPEDVVVHELPVALPDGRRGVVVRVYGVGDDPRRRWGRAGRRGSGGRCWRRWRPWGWTRRRCGPACRRRRARCGTRCSIPWPRRRRRGGRPGG